MKDQREWVKNIFTQVQINSTQTFANIARAERV